MQVITCASLVLANGDHIGVHHYTLYRQAEDRVAIGRVEEILAELGTCRVIGILITQCDIGELVLPYRLPSCTLATGSMRFLVFEVCPSS